MALKILRYIMKAISKQHGKSKWIDTKLSRHYVVEMAQALSSIHLPFGKYINEINTVHNKWGSNDKV